MRRASRRSVYLAAARASPPVTGSSLAHRSTSRVFSPASDSRRLGSALTRTAYSCRLGPRLDRGFIRQLEHAEHLDPAVGGLGLRLGIPGEDGAGRGLRVDRIGLAAPATSRPVGLVDLDDRDPGLGQVSRQACPTRTGAFDTGPPDLTPCLDPAGPVPGRPALRSKNAAGAAGG